ncbi:dihydroxy-acid dehydratase [Alphaproteobacteria bacterium]|jgi:dihydroxy-acid dehydratase|nr:dihydroxy-acid dehydratase [Kordiimonadaceae bacterium]MDA9815651.1 dihydroxy-acid dehydratase [Alphaproteobacteria bacterium]MDC3311718.1 dihydroxy-acid dehydratase [Alphaproteobacteria bacterium]
MDDKKGIKQNLTNYGDLGFSTFLRKSFIKGLGYSDEMLDKPIVGIINTFSNYNSCHGNVPDLIQSVRAGVLAQGAIPLEFPTISVHEAFTYPTSMYLRNLMAMDTEEMIRAQPMDSCVLIGGCDKTVPAQLMGALSVDMPVVQLVTGPMLTGSHRGERVGACTDCRRLWAKFRADEIDEIEINEANNQLVPTVGTCGVMGTASTMAMIAETLGMMPPDSSCAPAVSSERRRIAEKTGQIAVEIASVKRRPSSILTAKSFENALMVLLAIGGSTNGLIHLAAIAGRLGIKLDMDAFDALSRTIPVIVDLKPSGEGYMEDLYKAGGLPRILLELQDKLHLDALTITGKTIGQNIEETHFSWQQDVVKSASNPVYREGGMAVLKGNLAPDTAIIKQSAASDSLLTHSGRAVVFDGLEDLANRIDSDDLDVNKEDILVLRYIGPKGAPGMPEAGLIPIPKKLARQGVKDMVRISDGRMSGTASGTIILHVCPEAAEGGPLALVQTGDQISLDVNARSLHLHVDEVALANRRKTLDLSRFIAKRGYHKLYMEHVLQADRGVDFDFLV